MKWDMRKGSRNGFAVEIGKFRFQAGKPCAIILSTEGADGNVIAVSAAFVKAPD